MNIISITPTLNSQISSNKTMQRKHKHSAINFEGNFSKTVSDSYKKALGPTEEKIAKIAAAMADSSAMEKLVKFTEKHKIVKDNLLSHLIVLGSTVLSGFYIGKTLSNKKLDEEKRKTLAINQGLTYVASTVLAYTFDKHARPYFNKHVIENFKKANAGASSAQMAKWEKGLGMARTIIIIDMVYRFIAPVLVTPLANHIGNKIHENKKNKA